ncbi:MAG: transposase [Terriglobia bacterium]
MPLYHRFYCPGELQFLTASTYRRNPVFRSERFRCCFVQRLEEMHFLLVGWVLMPEYFHLLIRPEPAETTPAIMKALKEASAKRPAADTTRGRRLWRRANGDWSG